MKPIKQTLQFFKRTWICQVCQHKNKGKGKPGAVCSSCGHKWEDPSNA